MKLKLIRVVAFVSILFCTGWASAQTEYRAEIGVHSGVSYYLGDANSVIFKNMQPDYGMMFRYNMNERFSAQVEVNNTNITDGIFNNTLNTADVCGIFNFFDFDYKVYKPFSKKYTTYILAGAGMMDYRYEGVRNLKFSYILGVGFRLRLTDRLKMNVQWAHKLLLSDQMEGLNQYNNPAGLNGSNLLNNDVLSTFTIGLSYNIWSKKCNCYQQNW
jgi:hypothetical protein